MVRVKFGQEYHHIGITQQANKLRFYALCTYMIN
jgi:hypothetical protein